MPPTCRFVIDPSRMTGVTQRRFLVAESTPQKTARVVLFFLQT